MFAYLPYLKTETVYFKVPNDENLTLRSHITPLASGKEVALLTRRDTEQKYLLR